MDGRQSMGMRLSSKMFLSSALVIVVLSINVLGDWLRDALNPRLR